MNKNIKQLIVSIAVLFLFSGGVVFADRSWSPPDQTGNAGKFLQTDGTNTLWATAGGGGGVTSLNSLTGALSLIAGTGISVTPAGSNITIANTGLISVPNLASVLAVGHANGGQTITGTNLLETLSDPTSIVMNSMGGNIIGTDSNSWPFLTTNGNSTLGFDISGNLNFKTGSNDPTLVVGGPDGLFRIGNDKLDGGNGTSVSGDDLAQTISIGLNLTQSSVVYTGTGGQNNLTAGGTSTYSTAFTTTITIDSVNNYQLHLASCTNINVGDTLIVTSGAGTGTTGVIQAIFAGCQPFVQNSTIVGSGWLTGATVDDSTTSTTTTLTSVNPRSPNTVTIADNAGDASQFFINVSGGFQAAFRGVTFRITPQTSANVVGDNWVWTWMSKPLIATDGVAKMVSVNADNGLVVSNIAASLPTMVTVATSGTIARPTKVIKAPGTTGNQTINALLGQVNLAAAATSVTITNSFVDANSIVMVQVLGTDVTMDHATITKTSGAFTIIPDSIPTAETAVEFSVIN